MNVLSNVTRVIVALIFVLFCFWHLIDSLVHIAVVGQGWVTLFAAAVGLVFSAKFLPKQHPVRSGLRAVWNKM